jgi:ABC-type antimicrobial peptide transport system permease subunit
VLVLVAAVTLAVGGVGIMNIMLANVRSRIREIGIRKALGATYREIKLQFLAEAIIISLTGGIVGTIVGLAVPLSIRFFTDYALPISPWSVVIALTAATWSASSSAPFPPPAPPRWTPSRPSNMSNPDPNLSNQEEEPSQGPNLVLLYSLIALALAAAIGFAIMIVMPFYLRR